MKLLRVDDVLSPLENDVLSILWRHKKARVRQIYEELKRRRSVALSSVAVILDRLYQKGVVDRTIEKARGGVRYLYRAVSSKTGFERSYVEKAVNQLIEKFGPTAVAYFNERFKK